MTNNTRGRLPLLQQPRQITVNIEQAVYEQLQARAREQRLPVSELVRRALDQSLEEPTRLCSFTVVDFVHAWQEGHITAEEALGAAAGQLLLARAAS